MKLFKVSAILVIAILMFACSKSDPEDGEHFASTQQKALEKAQGVEDVLQDADAKKRAQAGMDDGASAESSTAESTDPTTMP